MNQAKVTAKRLAKQAECIHCFTKHVDEKSAACAWCGLVETFEQINTRYGDSNHTVEHM
jgi:hypothetical protein